MTKRVLYLDIQFLHISSTTALIRLGVLLNISPIKKMDMVTQSVIAIGAH